MEALIQDIIETAWKHEDYDPAYGIDEDIPYYYRDFMRNGEYFPRKRINYDEFKELLENHQKWLNGEEGGKRAVCNQIDFRGWGFDFIINHDFRNAVLHDCDFSGMRLTNIDFSGADLTDCKFENSCIKNCNFTNSDLSDCNFVDVELGKTDISGSNMDTTVLDCAKIYDIKADNCDVWNKWISQFDRT